jgi:hypothetical protein
MAFLHLGWKTIESVIFSRQSGVQSWSEQKIPSSFIARRPRLDKLGA